MPSLPGEPRDFPLSQYVPDRWILVANALLAIPYAFGPLVLLALMPWRWPTAGIVPVVVLLVVCAVPVGWRRERWLRPILGVESILTILIALDNMRFALWTVLYGELNSSSSRYDPAFLACISGYAAYLLMRYWFPRAGVRSIVTVIAAFAATTFILQSAAVQKMMFLFFREAIKMLQEHHAPR